MGCDLHLYVETANPTKTHWQTEDRWHCDEDGRWDAVVGSRFWVWGDRDYDFFALLGESFRRPQIAPIVPPRGFPIDASPELRWAYNANAQEWGRAMHDTSWLTLTELEAAKGRMASVCGDYPGWRQLLDKLNEFDLGPDCVRIVFWFDN